MNDMSAVIIPRSDQYNAEDFISGPRTFVIEDVSIKPGTEQPVSIKLKGESRVWRPCKSMSRCLVAAWGKDAKVYVGRSLTLYGDPTVKWGGLEVGGIRISHLSHIDKAMVLALTVTKGSKKPFTVRVLEASAPAKIGLRDQLRQACADAQSIADVEAIASSARYLGALSKASPEIATEMRKIISDGLARFVHDPDMEAANEPVEDDGFPGSQLAEARDPEVEA